MDEKRVTSIDSKNTKKKEKTISFFFGCLFIVCCLTAFYFQMDELILTLIIFCFDEYIPISYFLIYKFFLLL